ncbi:MAG: SUMF1/EgtB/PvdO family nonheme iron enzyme, partial [Limnothrix sp. RL_2_0]|nr:SUMF1/EgtB/PvdO family nonheme iron enzyme [Limnothrix sp. RL_2_0]
MTECRQLTLGLFTHLEDNLFRQQAHPDFSPAGWHLGHIAFIEAQWILEYFAGQAPIFSEYHQLFAADGLPKDQRQNLPSFEAIADYLTMVREKVFTYLKTAPIQQQERLWWWLLQHETQHNETISFVLALHKLRRGQPVFQTDQASTTPVKTTMVTVPAGEFRCGSDAIFAQDNERSPHTIYLDDYHIDTYPVTCSDFQTFIDSGGYNSAELWSPAGWAWQTQAK